MVKLELCISDLGQAAYLYAIGHKFVGLDYSGHGRYGFLFANEQGQAAKDANAYFASAMVPARELVEALKILKQVLYSEKEKGNGNGKWKAHPQPTR
jgi:hypothetical protein